MSNWEPSDWDLLVAEEIVSEPGDKLRGWKPNGEPSPIEGPGGVWYGFNTQKGANGVRFQITVKSSSTHLKKLYDAAKEMREVPIYAVLARNIGTYPPNYPKRIGAKRCVLAPGEGMAGTSEAGDVTFDVLGIDPVIEVIG